MMQCDLLGIRLVKCSKELFFENVSSEVKQTLESVAYKFHEQAQDEIKMRRKVGQFRCLMLVLRGNDIEHLIEKVYDR